MVTQLRSARRHYRLSQLLAQRAVREARKQRKKGAAAVITTVASYQVAQAVMSENAVGEMLDEQGVEAAAEAVLNSLAFTTSAEMFAQMLAEITDEQTAEFDRLVENLVQNAGRSAESVAVTVRPNIYYVRHVVPPCCSRCAVLAGRVYKYSTGFLRHPLCKCTMIPLTVASKDFVQDPEELAKSGQVTGLSQADLQAVRDGADLGKVVNVRRQQAGLSQSGRVLARRGRLTPEGIYKATNTREEAVALLKKLGYIR